MFWKVLIGGVVGLKVINTFAEEELIPAKRARSSKPGDFAPLTWRVAINHEDLKELFRIGAIDILKRGERMRERLDGEEPISQGA